MLITFVHAKLSKDIVQEAVKWKNNKLLTLLSCASIFINAVHIQWPAPGHKYVDEALVGVEFGRNVVFDPLVDGLRGGVCLDLHQQLLLQFQQGEKET